MHFPVPKTRAGRAFLVHARQFKNPEAVADVQARPRGSRRAARAEGFYLNANRDMPATSKHVTGWAVYLKPSKALAAMERKRGDAWHAYVRRYEQDRARKSVDVFLAQERSTRAPLVARMERAEREARRMTWAVRGFAVLAIVGWFVAGVCLWGQA
jgi:hypothetical protein